MSDSPDDPAPASAPVDPQTLHIPLPDDPPASPDADDADEAGEDGDSGEYDDDEYETGEDSESEPDEFDSLRKDVRGELVSDLDDLDVYNESKAIWNGDWSISNEPRCVLHCRGIRDICRGLLFSRRKGFSLTVRCGGYSLRGLSTNAGGIVLDLGRSMRSVRVNAKQNWVWFEGGCRVKDVDAETTPFGLATTLGSVGNVGVGGLVSGGGYGYFSRSQGLAVDNLLEIDVVLADGSLVTANETKHPDLFWGCRGGQSNFGVISSFKLRLFDCPPVIYAGLVLYDMVHAKDIIEAYQNFVTSMSYQAVVHLYFMPLSDKQKLLALQLCYLGDPATGEALFEPLINTAPWVDNQLKRTSYAHYQLFSDELYKIQGIPSYWRSRNVRPDVALPADTIMKLMDNAPPEAILVIEHYGGKTREVPQESTAYPHRQHEFVATFTGFGYQDPVAREAVKTWIDESTTKLADILDRSAYINYQAKDAAASFGPHLERLRRVKTLYDPENIFTCNVNVQPYPREEWEEHGIKPEDIQVKMGESALEEHDYVAEANLALGIN